MTKLRRARRKAERVKKRLRKLNKKLFPHIQMLDTEILAKLNALGFSDEQALLMLENVRCKCGEPMEPTFIFAGGNPVKKKEGVVIEDGKVCLHFSCLPCDLGVVIDILEQRTLNLEEIHQVTYPWMSIDKALELCPTLPSIVKGEIAKRGMDWWKRPWID